MAGVAGGLAHYVGIDPLVVRIGLVVLALFGGSGLLIYALGWLFMPDEGATQTEAQLLIRGRGALGTIILIVVLAVAGVYVFEGLGAPSATVAVAAIALAAYLAQRSRDRYHLGAPPASGWPAAPAAPASGAYGQTPGTAYAMNPSTATTEQLPYVPSGSGVYLPPPQPPRRKSALGRLTLSAALLVAGILAAVGSATSISVPAVVVFAAALSVVGAGLLAGAVYGRSRWLVVVGVLLAIATAGASVDHGDVSGGVGTRTWDPQTVAEVASPYEIGAGDAVLDLRDLDLASSGPLRITAHIGVGQLRVLAPEGVPIEVEAHVGLGQIVLPDSTGPDGVDNNASYSSSQGAGGPIALKLWVGVGNLEVRRAGI